MQAKFLNAAEQVHWQDVTSLTIGNATRHPSIHSCVGIRINGQQHLRVDIVEPLYDSCFDATVCAYGLLAIGLGDMLFLVNLTSHEVLSIPMSGYFGHIYPASDFPQASHPFAFLAASANDLVCISRTGSIEWVATNLGIDGVLVHDVQGNIITGRAEWDPPGGWKEFTLDISDMAETRVKFIASRHPDDQS